MILSNISIAAPLCSLWKTVEIGVQVMVARRWIRILSSVYAGSMAVGEIWKV